ncbi:MAG TPA: alpha/beta hydrolase [Verrucomicrobiae bacterium]|jgi:pimeloyl-ACP methyl ester carboxylesterase
MKNPFPREEKLQFRIYGDESLPALIYLPGMHGDWTLVGSFRKQVIGRVCFVEFTYPRTLEWSLGDYAAAIESALAENGITRGWLLGESFGSQVLWTMVGRKRFHMDGVILAGGFVRHPMRWTVRLAERLFGRISLRMITWSIYTFAKFARFRFRRSPETLEMFHEFVERRTKLDLAAAQYRLHLVAENDPCTIAKEAAIPVYGLTGVLDPIVPWPFVRRWLRGNCPALRDYQVIGSGDHIVLVTAPQKSAAQILKWML